MFQDKTSKVLDTIPVQIDAVPDSSFYSQEQIDKQKKAVVPVKPPVSARAYLVGNVETGKVYMEKNSKLVLPVASMSKLITSIESLDTMSSTTEITITESMLGLSDSVNLKAEEKFTVSELLHVLLLNSSNVAAEALASSTDRKKFLDIMPSYAWEVGMPVTYFADPSGIDPHNVSSASDFFALARYLYKLRPDILAITKTTDYILATTTDHGYHSLFNIHPFVRDPNFLGGKTGHTDEAKDTMLTIIKIGDQPVAVIVLSSDNRKADTAYLIGQVKAMRISNY